jgi:hypothetical protein
MKRKLMINLVEKIKYFGIIGFYVALIIVKFYKYIKFNRLSDKSYLERIFFSNLGYRLNLDVPLTLNEKLYWLKYNDRRDITTIHANKYLAREYIKKEFGDEFLTPLFLVTDNPTSIKFDDLPSEPFVIKSNQCSGDFKIVGDKKNINFNRLIVDCKWWLSFNNYFPGKQLQHLNIPPLIIIEKMLQTVDGKFPNKYKLHCINGEVEFIDVSTDGKSYNQGGIFDSKWKPLNFIFSAITKQLKGDIHIEELKPPKNLSKMITFAKHVAQMYAYVRVDFYDVDGKLYFGDIEHHQGGGFDKFKPIEVDYNYGYLLDLGYIKF